MNRMKSFLFLIFCASCRITHSKIMLVGQNLTLYPGDTSCPAIQLTCRPNIDIQRENFCVMNVKTEASSIGNCTTESGETFYFNITHDGRAYKVIMNETVRNIIMLFLPHHLQYLPSDISKSLKGSHPSAICLHDLEGLNVNKYLVDPQESCNEATYKRNSCDGYKGSKYILLVNGTEMTCSTCINPSLTISTSEASQTMDNLKNIANEMEINNQTIEEIVEDGVKGLVYRQNRDKEPKDIIVFSSSDQEEICVSESQNMDQKDYSWYVKIPAEAFKKSRLKNNRSTFVGVLQFTNMDVNDENHIALNNETYGISMGVDISNLTERVEIFIQTGEQFRKESCNSWDGRGNLSWTTFGCDTEIINKTIIKCSCSHLTFFAVLMSLQKSDTTNITSSHVNSLTYITNIGCGLSMFFLGIALFMHFLLRKNKSNQATKILMNMFVALFTLNLSFLSNESIANTQDVSGCTVIALIMHYSMLSTFTWFFLQALHMYLWLIRQNISIKNYMKKMIVSGWLSSCPVVLIIAALGEYKSVVITSNERTTRICWITNDYIHYIVNIGYYSVVFSFTSGVFIMILSKIIQARKLRASEVKKTTFKKQLMMILSLFVLLGLTWSVAFFSYGDMIIPSYYIFCVLNSFQGFFLFLYYYHIRDDVEGSFSDDPDTSSSGSTIDTVHENI